MTSPPDQEPDAQPEPRVRLRVTAEERQEMKGAALRLHAAGVGVMEIARTTGLSYGTVSTLVRDGVIAPLKKRGRTAGEWLTLSPSQQHTIRISMAAAIPRSLGLEGAAWSWRSASQLVAKTAGIQLSRRGVDNYLVRWGIKGTTERPPQFCVEAIRSWWGKFGPSVQAEAARAAGTILWLQRSITLTANQWKTAEAGRARLQLYLAKTAKGETYWRIIKGKVRPESEITFIKSLRNTLDGELILIRSNNTTYHRPKVLDYVRRTNGMVRLLPDSMDD